LDNIDRGRAVTCLVRPTLDVRTIEGIHKLGTANRRGYERYEGQRQKVREASHELRGVKEA
jgi:hypothetical protein